MKDPEEYLSAKGHQAIRKAADSSALRATVDTTHLDIRPLHSTLATKTLSDITGRKGFTQCPPTTTRHDSLVTERTDTPPRRSIERTYTPPRRSIERTDTPPRRSIERTDTPPLRSIERTKTSLSSPAKPEIIDDPVPTTRARAPET
ncbi:hypothetical protein RRG08_029462 [Elysia crispata]|uniref:Uncharacterized protein n=1 Tax=Elysia crispata TaxID=231223 RepID=A0AAE1BD26_9GAST|nr:hypothetical protein RRG08_029462 [Elysia crispata]